MLLARRGISAARIGIVVIIIVLLVAAVVYVATLKPSSTTTTSSSTTSSTSIPSSSSSSYSSSYSVSSTSTTSTTSTTALPLFGPANSSVLVDDSQTSAPDTLDPCCGDWGISDDVVYLNVYQGLVTIPGGPNCTQGAVIPDLAENYTVTGNQNYTFTLRPDVTFSNGDAVNASTAWFSFVRNLYSAMPIQVSDFEFVTESPTIITTTGLSIPWGLLNATQAATGLPVTTNYKLAQTVLNNILSNFNANNATIQKIMDYPNQAYVVTGPMTFQANELRPYGYFLINVAQWWGDLVDPAYVDAHGGVQANVPNSYFALYGGPGTGPYYISSVVEGYATIVLKANPTYWGLKVSNLPVVLRPAKIPVVVINYALSSNERSLAFDTNTAQISFLDTSVMGQMWSGYKFKPYTNFNQVFYNFGVGPNTMTTVINVGKYPTNNTDFRQAIVHAINYTEMLDESYSFNGSHFAQEALGPLSQPWGAYYNPDNLPMYSYNLSLAISLLNTAGQQEDFSVTLPNGTVIGNTTAPTLGPIEMVYIAPNTPVLEIQESIIQSDLAQIGLSVYLTGVTAAVAFATYITPQATPSLWVGSGWGPDWNDPILQELGPILTPEIMMTWMNLTSVNNILTSLAYNFNTTQRIQGVAQIYNITYNYAPYIWLPNYDNFMFVQPYVHGLVYAQYTTTYGQYWYNTLYYGPCTSYGCNNTLSNNPNMWSYGYSP